MNPAWQSSYTETTSELKEGTYTVKAVFEDRFAAFYRLYPAATVTISIKKIPSIKTALSDPAINQVFDQAIITFAGQVKSDTTACIPIGRALELNQNFTHADAVYSLARIVYSSGIPVDKITTCLGTDYGPEVIQDAFWKQHSKVVLTKDMFPPGDQVIPPYSVSIFDAITNAMTAYAAGTHNDAVLNKYFSPKVIVNDAASLIDSSTDDSIETTLGKLAKGQYVYYGCHKADSDTDPDYGSDVALMLAIDKTMKLENIVVIRAWWKFDQPNNPQPRIYQISVGSDSLIVKAQLDADNNQCGLHINIPKPAGSPAPTPGSPPPH